MVKKQEKNEINNEETENSVKIKNHRSDYYIADLNVNFYDIKAYNQKENKESEVNFVIIAMISCCNYHQSFKSRNILFHHLHSETAKITHCFMRKITAKSLTMMLIKSSDKLLKIISINSVAVIKDIRTGYDFCNWHYVMTKTQLSDKATSEFICLNMKYLVTLLDHMFFKSQHTKVKIHTMTMLISVWEISFNKHMTNEYVIVSIHLAGTVKSNQQEVEAIITWEAHLVDGLKTKMLVEMNIMRPEQINIITLKKQIIIDICQNTVISIKICLWSSSIKHIIHIKFNIVISLHIKQPISVYHIRHLPEQDFLFKLKDSSNLALYAYMIDFSLSVIIT